jgi:hypothetical protein
METDCHLGGKKMKKKTPILGPYVADFARKNVNESTSYFQQPLGRLSS